MSFLSVLYDSWWFTGEGMHATFDRLGRELGFDWEHRPTMDQLSAAVDILLAQREDAIVFIEEFSCMRKDPKRRGRRQLTGGERRLLEQGLSAVQEEWASSVGVPIE